MTLAEMSLILLKYKSLFQNVTLEASGIKIWFELFEDESAEAFHAAFSAAVKEPGRAFFPTPGEVNKILELAKRGPQFSGGLIWEELISFSTEQAAANFLRPYPAAARALRAIGGFKTIRLSNIEKELPFRRLEFIKLCDTFQKDDEQFERIEISAEHAKNIIGKLNGAIPRKLLENAKA